VFALPARVRAIKDQEMSGASSSAPSPIETPAEPALQIA
jgi:hypothetical protein